MTREENESKLQELRSAAEELVSSYNSLMLDGKFKEAKEAEEKLTDVVNEYTSVARTICFDECKASDDAMLAAIKILTYQSINFRDEKIEDSKLTTRKIVDRDKAIDLRKLDKYCGGIGKDAKWAYMIEKFNMCLTAQKALDLGVSADELKKINDSYAMSAIAREINLGKTPCSKSAMLKTLQGIINAMIGEEFKVTSHDVNYLLSIYAKKNRKALTVTCANHKYITQYIAEVCNHIVTGAPYCVEYKSAK